MDGAVRQLCFGQRAHGNKHNILFILGHRPPDVLQHSPIAIRIGLQFGIVLGHQFVLEPEPVGDPELLFLRHGCGEDFYLKGQP
ncbi:MAG: hypothetical protein DMG52_05210 [Acidobacteria bacterium]|nr:MAG: hypothetical protein DMG52_05210 [Acidobacteriota bacterium]